MTSIFIALALQAAFSSTAHMVAGDTLTICAQSVRLSGIDAPEFAQRCGV